MILEDRELLAALARLNSDVVPLAMKLMEGSATAEEQYSFAGRMVTLGERLKLRADATGGVVIDGQVLGVKRTALPMHTVEPD
ncbi:MAG: hypothetical protein ACRDUV_04680 [Pseudonocardiaceae bacterium]